jgi:hypothetical protein
MAAGPPVVTYVLKILITALAPASLLALTGLGYADVQFTSMTGTQVIGTAAGTPEPSTVALLGAGIAFVGFRKLRNSNHVRRIGHSATLT